MGPHVFACGNSTRPYGSQPRRAASMGPHVFACGNITLSGIKFAIAFVLQWGRTFLRAEIYSRHRPQSHRYELQWGRTFLRAEIYFDMRGQISALKLQWGRTFLRAEIPVRVERL